VGKNYIIMEGKMLLTGCSLKAARHYQTVLSGDKQETYRLLAKAQDCATDAIAILSNITEYEAMNNRFISKVVGVLIEKGFKIRFKPEPTPEPTKREKERATYEKIRLLPFYSLLERHGVADKAIKAIARS